MAQNMVYLLLMAVIVAGLGVFCLTGAKGGAGGA